MSRMAAVPSILLAVLLAGTSACSDSSGPKEGTPPAVPGLPGLVVSAPFPVGAVAGSVEASGALSVSAGVVYVSLVPGSVPDGQRATIRNQATAESVIAAVVNGGFDPVAIVASVGDTLAIEITRSGAGAPLAALAVVRAARPPVVVRTDPPKKQVDVPLNAIIVIVFSAPIDPTTLTTGSLQLWRDTIPVTGTVRFADAAQLRAEFHPDSLLAPETDYRFVVTQGIRDVNGDALLSPVEVPFTTGTAAISAVIAFVESGNIQLFTNSGHIAGRRLTTTGRDASPAWSPDGRRIAFTRYDSSWVGHLYLMDADGSNARLLRRSDGDGFGDGFNVAAWSPDGRTLAVDQGNFYWGNIYLVSVDDTGAAPVHVASMAAHPAWSPDGSRIAFVSLSGDDGYHALHVMNADGSNVTELTVRDPGGIFHPTWSPDGQRIAFTKCFDGGCDVFAVSGTSTAATDVGRLTTVGDAGGPAWSPDGLWIAVTVGGWPETAVAYVAASGGEPTPLIWRGHSPAWRP